MSGFRKKTDSNFCGKKIRRFFLKKKIEKKHTEEKKGENVSPDAVHCAADIVFVIEGTQRQSVFRVSHLFASGWRWWSSIHRLNRFFSSFFFFIIFFLTYCALIFTFGSFRWFCRFFRVVFFLVRGGFLGFHLVFLSVSKKNLCFFWLNRSCDLTSIHLFLKTRDPISTSSTIWENTMESIHQLNYKVRVELWFFNSCIEFVKYAVHCYAMIFNKFSSFL